VIRYRRRGHAGSTPIDGPVSIAEHAQDCRALLGELDVTQAHVVGHSLGALVALQLAADAPRAVSSLALFEPAWLTVPSAPQTLEAMGPIVEKYLAGDRVAAVDGFFSLVFGSDWQAEVNRTVREALNRRQRMGPPCSNLIFHRCRSGASAPRKRLRSSSRCSSYPGTRVCRCTPRAATCFTHGGRAQRTT
jgi:pimeloyl-ACP methyl ester carboxylesterase